RQTRTESVLRRRVSSSSDISSESELLPNTSLCLSSLCERLSAPCCILRCSVTANYSNTHLSCLRLGHRSVRFLKRRSLSFPLPSHSPALQCPSHLCLF